MNIIIIGAGTIGSHLALVLSQKGHNIILIDKDPYKVEEAARRLDISAKVGLGTDWVLLESLKEHNPNLLLALTDCDETNLVAASIAKQLGYPKTIARISQNQFINCERLDIKQMFHADYLISPELLVAADINKLMSMQGPVAIENFAHGAAQMHTLAIPKNWDKQAIPIAELKLPENVRIALIRRSIIEDDSCEHSIHFPRGDDVILPLDEITFIGDTKAMSTIYHFFGIPQKKVSSIVIVGGSQIGYHLARLLQEAHVRVKIIDKSYDRCTYLAESLSKCTVLHHEGSDLPFLLQENIEHTDFFVACTRKDEMNLLLGKLARKAKASHVIACISNPAYGSIAKEMGIQRTITFHKSTENKILSLISKEKVSSIVSLYENEAEVVEIKVSMESKMTGIPIAKLVKYLPKDLLFAVIQSKGKISIANGNSVLTPSDTVIIITNPKNINILSELF
ncbi:MAG: Trk system potassium transporter TrkA [Chlamydiales bacterium]|nr:Trk system potassium transporter TrkA [Chlamydiales bacterium]